MWKIVSFSIGLFFIFCRTGLAFEALTETDTFDEQEYLKLYYEEEELVETATHYPKLISQVAENVTIIDAKEIEAMNAHTVADVINRVAGVFISFSGKDYANHGFIRIHGSDYEHVLVLVDGIRWNHAGVDSNITNQIPLQIIKRIEVIKGASSSSWGSALGGVVNIITKDAGETPRPKGTVKGSYGEHDSQDYRAEVSGMAGWLGYYLYAGYQDSDGIRDDRFFENQSFYGKFGLNLPRDIGFELSFGYSNPRNRYLHIQPWDFEAEINDRTFFYTATLDMMLNNKLSFNLTAHTFEDTFTDSGNLISTGELTDKTTFDAETRGFRGRLALDIERHTTVLGIEYEHRKITDIDKLNQFQAPTDSEEIWAVFINDTYRLGKASITPGIRYDHFSIADNIVSPSIGITYRLKKNILLRAAVARGFRKPPVSLKQGDPYFNTPNPLLESEKTWTYQAGLDTTAIKYFQMKGTVFLHDAEDDWVRNPNSWAWENNGSFKRYGVELEGQTIPFYHFSVAANATFVRMVPEGNDSDTAYNANIIFAYDNPQILQARLMGHYNWWGTIFSPDYFNGDYGRFIWDFTLIKKIFSLQYLETEVFFTVYNLFNGSDFADEFLPNAGRWLEGGVKFHF